VGFGERGEHGRFVPGLEPEKVDDLRLDPVLAQRLRGGERGADRAAIGDSALPIGAGCGGSATSPFIA
jgi:hypothetical protein